VLSREGYGEDRLPLQPVFPRTRPQGRTKRDGPQVPDPENRPLYFAGAAAILAARKLSQCDPDKRRALSSWQATGFPSAPRGRVSPAPLPAR
jgi:hypothetical protein